MAKEKTAFDEIQRLQQEFEEKIASKREAALAELREELAEARKVVRDIENQIAQLTGKKGNAEGVRKCSICGKIGHNSRSCPDKKRK